MMGPPMAPVGPKGPKGFSSPKPKKTFKY
jgi:hypothetical protein